MAEKKKLPFEGNDAEGMGLMMVASERVSHKPRGWSLEYDEEEHGDGELARIASILTVAVAASLEGGVKRPVAALVYAEKASRLLIPGVVDDLGLMQKTEGNPLRRLVVAASLITAEIDRRLREAKDDEELEEWVRGAMDDLSLQLLCEPEPRS